VEEIMKGHCVVTALVMCLAACDDGHGIAVGEGTLSPSAPALTASITRLSEASRAAFGCLPGAQAVLPFNLVITALNAVNVNQVTIQMLDGTHLGGPMITFPQPELTLRFGTTLIPARTTRVFQFRPVFVCDPRFQQVVAANIVFLDGAGRRDEITVTGSLP
jgi:hypothetical protein